MLIDIHLTFDGADECGKILAVLGSLKGEVAVTKPKAEKLKVAEAKQAESEPVQTGIEDAITYEKVKSAVLKVAKEKGKAAALKALGVIGTDKVGPHIKESDYSKLMAACEKELG